MRLSIYRLCGAVKVFVQCGVLVWQHWVVMCMLVGDEIGCCEIIPLSTTDGFLIFLINNELRTENNLISMNRFHEVQQKMG